MKSRAVRSGTETAKSIKLPTKVQNAATANNTRRNQTPDAAETAVLAAVGVKLEEFSDTLASCDSSTGHIVTGQTGTLEVVKTALSNVRFGSEAEIAAALPNVCFTLENGHHRKPRHVS